MTSEKIKNLIFIENAEQVNFFTNHFNSKNFFTDYKVIAIGPSAQSALINLNISFTKSDNYFKNHDHVDVLNKAEEVVNEMRNEFLLSDFLKVKHAYEREFFSFFRYYYLNYCLSLLTIIHNATSIIKPDKIILPAPIYPKDLQGGNDSLSRISLIGYLGELYALTHDCEVIFEGAINKSKKIRKQKKYSFILSYIDVSIFHVQLLIYKFFSRGKNVILNFNSSYNVPRVMDYIAKRIKSPFKVGGSSQSGIDLLLSVLKGNNGNFFKFPPPASKKQLNKFNEDYDNAINKIEAKIHENPDIFRIHDVCLRSLIIDRIKNGLKSRLKETFFVLIAFDKILKAKKPIFLLSNQACGYHYAIGEQCRNNNINAMLLSHGTHVSHKEKWIKNEWSEHGRFMITTHYPLVSVQTPWTKEFLNDQNHTISEQIVTGPLVHSRSFGKKERLTLREKIFPKHSGKKIILHAASPFGLYVFHPFVNLTHDEYVRHINDLITSVESMNGVFLAIRIRLKSFRGMSLNDVKSLFIKSDCYEIYTEGSFEDYLLSSDLLVSFSSTTIEEALQVKIPVLQYDPFNRYSHIPAHNLYNKANLKASPIYYVSGFDNLLWSLTWIKDNHLEKIDSGLCVDWSPHIIDFSEDWISQIIEPISIK